MSTEELPPSARHEQIKAFWQIAESVGTRAILQHVLDDLTTPKLARLLAWVERQQRAGTGAVNAEEDAIKCITALGESRERALGWLEKVRAQGGGNCNRLVSLMLAERNKR